MKQELATIIEFSPVVGTFSIGVTTHNLNGKHRIEEEKKGLLKTYFQYPSGDLIEIEIQFKKNSIELYDRGISCANAEEHSTEGSFGGEGCWDIINDICVQGGVELDDTNWSISKTIQNYKESKEFLSMEICGFIQTCLLISNLVL